MLAGTSGSSALAALVSQIAEWALSGYILTWRYSGEYQDDGLLLGEEGLEALQRRGEDGKLSRPSDSKPHHVDDETFEAFTDLWR